MESTGRLEISSAIIVCRWTAIATPAKARLLDTSLPERAMRWGFNPSRQRSRAAWTPPPQLWPDPNRLHIGGFIRFQPPAEFPQQPIQRTEAMPCVEANA